MMLYDLGYPHSLKQRIDLLKKVLIIHDLGDPDADLEVWVWELRSASCKVIKRLASQAYVQALGPMPNAFS